MMAVKSVLNLRETKGNMKQKIKKKEKSKRTEAMNNRSITKFKSFWL